MANQALYRKYRSRDFDDLIGQRHITQTLMNAIGSGRVAHAYLFCGPRGTGKTSTARVLAKALNCVNGPTSAPCDVCPYCTSIRQGNAIDVIEIDAASNRNIDDIRQLREQVNYPPVELRYKFYIVDEVHQLTRDSFNAFLKTLEEPPAQVIFVLCTTDPHQLPPTILSRCQRFDFHRITLEHIIERLRWVVAQEGWTVEDEALSLLARTANGGMRDALSLLDQAASYAGEHISAAHVRDILGGIDFALLHEYSGLILARDAEGLFHLVERVISEGKDVPQLVAELIQYWRNLLRVKIGGAGTLVELAPEQRDLLAQQAGPAQQSTIMRAVTLLCEAENELRWNSQQRLLLELFSLRMMGEESAPQPAIQRDITTTRPAPRPEITTAAPRPAPRVEAAPAPAAPPPAEPAPASRPAPSVEITTAAESADGGAWTLPRVKKAWPQFIEWMRRSSKLDNLRERIVEKCWPTSLIGSILTLASVNGFVRAQLEERPQIKTALEQCLQSYFKTTFIVKMESVPEAPAAKPAPATQPAPAVNITTPAPAPEPDPALAPPPETAAPPADPPADPNRDLVAERMREVFAGSEEITE